MGTLAVETVQNPLRAEIHLLADAFLRKPVPQGMEPEQFLSLWRAWYSHWNPFVREQDALELLHALERAGWQIKLTGQGGQWRCSACGPGQDLEGSGTGVHSAIVDMAWKLVKSLREPAEG